MKSEWLREDRFKICVTSSLNFTGMCVLFVYLNTIAYRKQQWISMHTMQQSIAMHFGGHSLKDQSHRQCQDKVTFIFLQLSYEYSFIY